MQISFAWAEFFIIFIDVKNIPHKNGCLIQKHNGCNAGCVPLVNGKVGVDKHRTNID